MNNINKLSIITDKNLGKLMDIWRSSVLATHDFLSEEDFNELDIDLSQYLLSARNVYIYKEAGKIKAFLQVNNRNIDMLFVGSKFFGSGIGRKLMNFAINQLGANKVDVNEQNIKALEFYRKFEFKCHRKSPLDGDGRTYPILHLKL